MRGSCHSFLFYFLFLSKVYVSIGTVCVVGCLQPTTVLRALFPEHALKQKATRLLTHHIPLCQDLGMVTWRELLILQILCTVPET